MNIADFVRKIYIPYRGTNIGFCRIIKINVWLLKKEVHYETT